MSEQPRNHTWFRAPAFLEDPEEPAPPLPDDPRPADARPWEDPDAARPPGYALARWLEAGLVRRGWKVEYRWATDLGHAFDARHGSDRFDVTVRAAEAGEAGEGWLLTAEPRAGLLSWLRERREGSAEHRHLLRDLHAVLGDVPSVADARWLTEAAWQAGRLDAGAEAPEG